MKVVSWPRDEQRARRFSSISLPSTKPAAAAGLEAQLDQAVAGDREGGGEDHVDGELFTE